MEQDEEFYWFWLCNIPGIGNITIEKLLQCFDSPRAVYQAEEACMESTRLLKGKEFRNLMDSKKNSNIYQEYLNMKKKNIRMIVIRDEEYPKRLRHIYNPPACLYLKGKLPDENTPSVAVVGARGCSEYGRQTAYGIGRQLAMAGVSVISGLARGIDSAAHEGALALDGYTMGVLAGGVDRCYPRENIGIYMQMEEKGGILSEFPPGMEPLSKHFPLRNRIISGLSDVVVVVEAREKSGSLITVDSALEQNRLVMAVPGRMGDELSKGCNHLIKIGAGVVTTPGDILETLCYEVPELREKIDSDESMKHKKNINLLARSEEMVYSCLDLTPQNVNYIIEETGLGISAVTEALVSLSFKELIREISPGYYVTVKK